MNFNPQQTLRNNHLFWLYPRECCEVAKSFEPLISDRLRRRCSFLTIAVIVGSRQKGPRRVGSRMAAFEASTQENRHGCRLHETWIKTSMAPLRGWGPKGDRVRGFVPRGHWRTLTFLGALRCDQLAAPCVFDGPINGECFRAYVEQRSCHSSNPATSSSWIISAATSRLHSAPSSGPPAQGSGTCRPTHPTSIRSSRLSPRSNTGCVPLKSEPSKMPGNTSAAWSTPSIQPNATTTSQTPDTLPSKNETL